MEPKHHRSRRSSYPISAADGGTNFPLRLEVVTMALKWPRPERRLSGIRDRRLAYRGGRRTEDRVPLNRASPDIPCAVCRVGLASRYDVSYEQGQRVTAYRCAVCGHIQHRVTPA